MKRERGEIMAVGIVIVIVLLSGGGGGVNNSLEWMCAGGGDKSNVEWISCRCFFYGYFYSLYSRVQFYRGDSMKNI